MRKFLIRMIVVVLLAGLLLPAAAPAPAPARAQAEAPTDTPTPLVASGVTKYTLAAPKVFWYTGVPPCPPGDQPSDPFHETIKRVATYGSPERTLYDELRNCNGTQIYSNIVSDGSFLYWLSATALMKLSTDANPGDAPQIMNALVNGFGEVADGGDVVFALYSDSIGNYYIDYVRKDNNQRVPVTASGSAMGNLQWDGRYVYYISGTTLYRIEPGVSGPTNLASGVTGYYPEGRRLLFCTIDPFQCFFSDNVYVGQGANVRIYDNNNGTLGSPIYTSPDPTASIYSLVTDFSNLFFLESRTIACSPQPCFPSYTMVLQRTGRSGGTVNTLYNLPSPTVFALPNYLRTDGTFLFWHENDQVLRLPNNASALPVINMSITGMEVTQGIQNLSNSVLLVKNKRTFVRVYVKSDGPSVSGVSASLYAPSLGLGPLQPVNSVGTKITVRTNPNRDDLNQSFLFELPWNWITGNTLYLRAELNPYKVPLEPNYGDNTATATLTLKDSPSLSVEFFRLNYRIGGTTYSPRIQEDVVKTYSWIQRAYPIGGAIGQNFKPRLWDVDGGTGLGGLVNQSNIICSFLYPNANERNLCASYVTNGWLFSYRVQTIFGLLNVGLKTNAFYYGMISDASNNFPRGQAAQPMTSVGPAGTPGQFFGLGQGWDTDGSYADWYAAHEIGHSLGRAHPNAGSDDPNTSNTTENCGHSRSDPSFPYGNTSTARAPIGPADNSMEGFDAGDPYFGIARAVYPSSTWNDVMSYCSNQWLSDYTYTGMYNYMIAHPSLQDTSLPQAGDFLIAAGVINPGSNVAGFSYLRRSDNVVNVPDLVPGDYSLRLLDASDTVLADYAFTPLPDEDTGTLGFSQVVDFVAGTRAVQVVKLDGDVVLATQAVSANPPTISDVALQGAPDPVTGVVTLAWTASDPDAGDTLSFDVAYSRDGGATFQPVTLNLSGDSTQIDTANLGGSGTAILRVTASDGVNSAYADSAPFTMANKAPEPAILTPENNLHIHYGQLVNFSGMAMDAQDGTVADAGLSWWDANTDAQLGTGPLLSLDSLPVGENTIVLQAMNSVGVTATTSVTVFVDDDLSLPGPTLTAGPSPVGWQVNADSTEVQTADIAINNSGSGDLGWSASVDAPWLSTSVVSGTVSVDGDAFLLTLNADPSGLAAGSTYTATLTLTSDGLDPVQTVAIPVSLSVGDVHTVAPGEREIFLPFIQR
jgi:hypothetical protein